MIILPNGCWCSTPSVFPSNWKTKKASLQKNWYINYWFHDPVFKKPKQVILKGMNWAKDLENRRNCTEMVLNKHLDLLIKEGYNPITGECCAPEINQEIDSSTPLIKALQFAKKKIQCAESTERDLRTMLPHAEKAAKQLRFDNIPIGQVKRKHIKNILERMDENHKFKSAHRYNKYRTNFMMLFAELTEHEAIEFNLVRDIRKKKIIHRLREILTTEERIEINNYLKERAPALQIFTHIFFHSGARETEIIKIKGADVNLKKQQFKVLIKKGRAYKETWKTIKDVALPFWEIAMENCGLEDYVFGKNLVPGPVAVNRDWITKKWQKLIKYPEDKGGLGINKDFYSLKHANADETASLVGIDDAAAQASHTTPVITLKHYLVNEKERQNERLKKVNNPFA